MVNTFSEDFKAGRDDGIQSVIRVLNNEIQNINSGKALNGFYHDDSLQRLVENIYRLGEKNDG